jgi:hypothetical protein
MKKLICMIPFIFIGCSSLNFTDKCEKLKWCLTDNDFFDFFELSKRKDTINVFSTDKFSNCQSLVIKNEKIIVLKKYDGSYNINDASSDKTFQEILLYDYKENQSTNTIVFSFVNTVSNGTLKMTFDLKGKLIDLKKGAF